MSANRPAPLPWTLATGAAHPNSPWAGSSGSSCASTFITAAMSATVRAIGPGESSVHITGITPTRLTSPTVGFSPTTPQAAAGQVIEPFVSTPSATGAYPSATAAADPELEPPGDIAGS